MIGLLLHHGSIKSVSRQWKEIIISSCSLFLHSLHSVYSLHSLLSLLSVLSLRSLLSLLPPLIVWLLRMAGAVAKALVAIEAQRQYFITNTDHSLKQADCFDKILELFKRDPRPDDKPSTRSRRKTAHRILTAVLQSLGFEAFLLCSFALSITALVEIKSPEEFIVKFREWQKSKEMPENLSTVARKYEDDYGRHLLQTGMGI